MPVGLKTCGYFAKPGARRSEGWPPHRDRIPEEHPKLIQICQVISLFGGRILVICGSGKLNNRKTVALAIKLEFSALKGGAAV